MHEPGEGGAVTDGAAPPPGPPALPPALHPRPASGGRGWLALDALLAGLAVAAMLTYWVTGLRRDPIDVVTIYRDGDYEYFPLVAGLAEPTLGDPIHWEDHGEGVVSFPLPSLLPHAVATRVFGAYGFLVLDVLLVTAVYAIVAALLRALLIPRPLAALLAFASACGSAPPLQEVLGLLGLWVTPLWGIRFPRPLVADVYLLLSCLLLLRLVAHGAHQRAREWALAGATLGLVVQSEPYAAPTLIAVHLAGAVHLALGPLRGERRRLLLRLSAALAAFALVCSFYVVQRVVEDPGVPARLGLFPIARGTEVPSFWPTSRWPLVLTVLTLALSARHDPGPERRRALACLAGLVGVSAAALPGTCLLLGKTIQPYHFAYMNRLFCTLAAYACVGAAVAWLARAIAGSDRPLARRARGRAGVAVAAGAGAWLVLGQLEEATGQRVRAAKRSSHLRTDLDYHFELTANDDYRRHFDALVQTLRSPAYADARVLGTLDAQVLAWWSLHGGRFAFAPGPFMTTAPDALVEERLLRLLALLDLEEARLGDLLDVRYVNAYFFGHAKYQASRARTFAPLSDYTPEARARISSTTFFDSWNLELPLSERRRLEARYREQRRSTEPLPRLDVIVLLNDAVQRDLRPDPARFVLTHESAVFRVYRPSQPP